MCSRRGFLKRTLGPVFTAAPIVDQAMFRAVRARAQANYTLPVLFDIQRLAEGVFFAQAKPQTLVNCNAVIFENTDDLLILDSHSKPSAVASLVRQLRDQVSKKPVRYVVASHFHWDHAQGLPAYRRIAPRAEMISTETTRRLIGEMTGPRLKQSFTQLNSRVDELKQQIGAAKSAEEKTVRQQMLRETQDYLREMENFVPELPNVTFDRDLVLHDKAHDLHLAFRGRAHTAGDLVVLCPQKKVIATGDVVHGSFPFLGDSFPLDYPRTVIGIAQMEFTQLAGGHGPAQQGKQRMYQLANYIEEVTEAVVRGRGKGKPVDVLQKEITPSTLRTLADGGYGEFVARNILAYRMTPPPKPTAAEVIATGIREAVGFIYARLDAN